MLGWLTLIVAALAGLFVFFQHHAGVLDAASAGFVAAGVIGLLIAIYVGAHKSRGHFEKNHLLLPVAIVAAVLTAGAWWFAPSLSGLLGASSSTSDNREPALGKNAVSVLIRKNDDGKFVANGQINGTPAEFLIDTGATAVMIRNSDADKAGIDASTLAFTTPVQTANGTVYAASVRLRSITIGALRIDDVEALVAQPGKLNENLLGISFLRRLASYDVHGDFLTLRE